MVDGEIAEITTVGHSSFPAFAVPDVLD